MITSIDIMENSLVKLIKSRQTVFTTESLALIWQIANKKYLKTKTYRLIRDKKILSLRRGCYVLDKDYDIFELANKLFSPSYISTETALAQNGISFQYFSAIYCVGRYNRIIKVGDKKFVYRKLSENILMNPRGIDYIDRAAIASKERALLDTLYFMPDMYFDNLNSINWQRCFSLVAIYDNRALEKRLNNLYKLYAKQK